MTSSFFEQVYQVVRLIPPGRVATYGQVARVLGVPRGARTVGWALRGLPAGSAVPWQRVINAQGGISLSSDRPAANVQREILEAEGIVFDAAGRADLRVYGWDGPDLAERRMLLLPSA